jgi:hypothetical protein
MEADDQVHLANPVAMQQYSGLKYTNDQSDARWLAHILRRVSRPLGWGESAGGKMVDNQACDSSLPQPMTAGPLTCLLRLATPLP